MRAIILLSLLAAGCGPLVQVGGNSPRPLALYTLEADSAVVVPAGLKPIDLGQAVSVAAPLAPGALQTVRIPVTVSDTAIQYVTGAQWSEQPMKLFQQLLADTLSARGLAVIDPRSSGQMGGRQLTGQLLAFGVDTRGSAPVVRVRYDATLTGADGIRQRRFEREEPLPAVDGPLAAAALNRATNLLAADVATWLGAPATRGG